MNNILRTLSVSVAFSALPAFGVVSFHDLAGAYTASSFVTGPTNDGQSGANGAYALVDYTTGTPTGTTLTVSGVGNHSNPGSWKAVGDVSTLFPEGDVINYTHSNFTGGGTHTLVISGLTAGFTYDLAIFADRGYAPSDDPGNGFNRQASFTLSGATSFTNTSSTGNAGVIANDGGASVTLRNGGNPEGNLARWSDIVPEGDSITISVTGGGYSGNALRFESTVIPEPATAALAGFGALGLLLRRRSRHA